MLMVNNAAPLAINISIYGFTSQLGTPDLGLIFALLLPLATAFLVWIKRPPALEVYSLGIVIALLAPPGTFSLGARDI